MTCNVSLVDHLRCVRSQSQSIHREAWAHQYLVNSLLRCVYSSPSNYGNPAPVFCPGRHRSEEHSRFERLICDSPHIERHIESFTITLFSSRDIAFIQRIAIYFGHISDLTMRLYIFLALYSKL